MHGMLATRPSTFSGTADILTSVKNRLTHDHAILRLQGAMEVHLNPEQEARLNQLATRIGKKPAQVLGDAVNRILEYDERFIAAVEEGRSAARRGDLLEHDEVVTRIEQMFR
jgi:predicted transcriptional regulator